MKIFDCFTFFNENELIELRLNLLAPYVDYFIIIESNITFRGEYKPFNFNINNPIINKYKNKIIYLPIKLPITQTTPLDYSIEIQQRNHILTALKKINTINDDDLIIISDLDEIPNFNLLNSIKNNSLILKDNLYKIHRIFRKNHHFSSYFKYLLVLNKYLNNSSILDILKITPLSLAQNHYYYYINYLHSDKWYGSVITLYKNLSTPQKLRDARRRLPILFDGGWHFAYMGGVDRILQKINSTVDENPHRNHNYQYDISHIKKCLNNASLMYDYQNKEHNVLTKVSLDTLNIPNIKQFISKYPYFYLK